MITPTKTPSDDSAARSRKVEPAFLPDHLSPQVAMDNEGERVDLSVTGMTCAACARRIEKQLTRVPGVRLASVNYATSRATLEYDPQATGTLQFLDTIAATGYGTAETVRAEFVVDDSARVSGSAAPLENHLSRVPGVVNAAFNLARMEVRIEYLPGSVDSATLRRAIEDFGYRAKEVPGGGSDVTAEESEAKARAAEYHDLRRKFWIAAALSLPILVIAMSHGRIAALNFPGVNWLQLALTTPVVFYCGAQFYSPPKSY